MFDAVVVGGGPAGTATAIACGYRGLRTLLLEAEQDPREQPGETLHPGMEPLFRLLGVNAQIDEANFIRHPGYFIRTRAGSIFQDYGSDNRGRWFGYQAERIKLHNLLLERAVASGVTVLRGERALRPIVCGNTVCGVNGTKRAYDSHFVVDATGSRQWLRRYLRLPCFRASTLLLAHYGWVESSDKLKEAYPLPEFRIDRGGWLWVAPTGSGKHAWISMNFSGAKPTVRLPDILVGSVATSQPKARDVTWKIARPCAGSGYFLVGDAACILDPASSQGVLKAIMSGIAAAESVDRILKVAVPADRAIEHYCTWIEERFCSDASALISLYSRMEEPPLWLSAACEAVRYIATSPWERTSSSKLTQV